jgi:hypothetical protein
MFNSNEKIDIKYDKIKDTIKKEDTNTKKEDKIKPIFVCNAKCNECLSKKCYLI